MSNGPIAAPTWAGRIKPMFADHVRCMNGNMVFNKLGYTIDLSDYDVVKANAISIYGMIKNGQMPPGNPLPDADVQAFKEWMDAGFPL